MTETIRAVLIEDLWLILESVKHRPRVLPSVVNFRDIQAATVWLEHDNYTEEVKAAVFALVRLLRNSGTAYLEIVGDSSFGIVCIVPVIEATRFSKELLNYVHDQLVANGRPDLAAQLRS